MGSWPDVEEEAARFATIVTYDRAGTGRSEAPEVLPTADDMAEELASVLNSLAVNRPVILVGFSMAAFLVQLFACRRPAEVAGRSCSTRFRMNFWPNSPTTRQR